MKKETINDYLIRRLTEFKGHHHRIAREAGIAQATVSRIFLGQASPSLKTAQPLLDWFEAHDSGKSAARVPNTRRRLQAGRANRSAPTALSQ